MGEPGSNRPGATDSRVTVAVLGALSRMLLEAVACQVVLAFSVEGEGPVRFGVPVPAEDLRAGLRLDGPHEAFQWSTLTTGLDAESERVWIEVAVDGRPGRYRLQRGGSAARPNGSGAAVERWARDLKDGAEQARVSTWSWHSGVVDRVRRTLVPGAAAGEWSTERSEEVIGRRSRVRIPPDFWRDARVLPARTGAGTEMRSRLLDALPELPRCEGHPGDYVRGRPDDTGARVKTNLEFDTTLGFLRLALVCDREDLLRRALESATYLCDRNVDVRSGLPFRHGRGHRSARPEFGHCWWTGALSTALTFADRDLRDHALEIGRAVARGVQAMEPAERLRDVAWPLLELERHLTMQHEPLIEQACDRLARDVLDRWDEAFDVVRFAEGEVAESVYRDRCWQTCGILLPGLRAWSRRTRSPEGRRVADRIERRVSALMRNGKRGVPIQFAVGTRGVFGVSRRENAPIASLLLDGMSSSTRKKLLARRSIRSAIEGGIRLGSDDLATDFSIVARCSWVYE